MSVTTGDCVFTDSLQVYHEQAPTLISTRYLLVVHPRFHSTRALSSSAKVLCKESACLDGPELPGVSLSERREPVQPATTRNFEHDRWGAAAIGHPPVSLWTGSQYPAY